MKLLDLFCGAGGAAMGYYRAGFDDITGIDNKFQKHYPFKFIHADALEYLAEHGHEYDAIHASPPCQAYSMAGQQWRKNGKEYPDLIAKTRELLIQIGKPYVIENVPGSPLIDPLILNGTFFNMKVRRVRHFETSFPIEHPPMPKEQPSHFRMGCPVREGDVITPVGHFSNVEYARRVMGINWMTGAELTQAIPPIYTEWIGVKLITVCENELRKLPIDK